MKKMNTYSKNRLQEYCQSKNISLPKYLIKKESGPPHIRKFQVFLYDEVVLLRKVLF